MPLPHWKIYVELQTSRLADDGQLRDLAESLQTNPILVTAAPATASLGGHYSVTAKLTLTAADAQAAQEDATMILQAACAKAGIVTVKVIARGLLPPEITI